MAERINRRELIVQTAATLFSKQGYAATSVRQIAETVGCTEAALYYHFKEGKRALLQAVIEDKTPSFLSVLENCYISSRPYSKIWARYHNILRSARAPYPVAQVRISQFEPGRTGIVSCQTH